MPVLQALSLGAAGADGSDPDTNDRLSFPRSACGASALTLPSPLLIRLTRSLCAQAPEAPTPLSPSEHRESFSDEFREELEALQASHTPHSLSLTAEWFQMEHARLQEEHDQLQEECDGKVDTLQAKAADHACKQGATDAAMLCR